MRTVGDRSQDLALRALGLLAAAIAIVALRGVCDRVQTPPHHEASFAEMILAAIGFAGMSTAATLVTLGRHIFDRVEISRRWGRSQDHVPLTLCADRTPPSSARAASFRPVVQTHPDTRTWSPR